MIIELKPNQHESAKDYLGRIEFAIKSLPQNDTTLDLVCPTSSSLLDDEISSILTNMIPAAVTKLHFCICSDDLRSLHSIPQNVETVRIRLTSSRSFSNSSYPTLSEILDAIPHTVKYIGIDNYNLGTKSRRDLEQRAREEEAKSFAFDLKCYAALSGIAGGIILVLGLALLQPGVAVVGATMVGATFLGLGLFAYKSTLLYVAEPQATVTPVI